MSADPFQVLAGRQNPERVTQNPAANEQLLYFTSSSLWQDDSHLVFISDRDGSPNIYQQTLATGEILQLSHNTEGYLKSYVYFDGFPYKGFGKASVALHSPSGTAYYIQGREIRKVDSTGKNVKLAEYPHGQMTAFTHVSADGTRIVVPTTDARALDGDKQLSGRPSFSIDKRVVEEGLNSYLRVYDTTTGEELVCEQVPKCWITHVQFDPNDNQKILYNHEWAHVDVGIRRMWLFDGVKHIQLRTPEEGRSGKDNAVHEMWERDGSAIIYHGKFHNGLQYLGRMKPDRTGLVEIKLPKRWFGYGHYTVGAPGMIITDGYFRKKYQIYNPWRGRWISQIFVDWTAKRSTWIPLCRHKSSWTSQDVHPHPIIDHNLTYAYFTSDFEGKRAVYRVKIMKQNQITKSF